MRRVIEVLLLVGLTVAHCYADTSTSCSGSDNGPPSVSIGSVVSVYDANDADSSASPPNSTGSSLDPTDFVLVSNASVSSSWIDGAAGFDEAAGGKILYQAATWTLLEEGTQSGRFESYWARFTAVKRSLQIPVRMSMCAMVAKWNSSWVEKKSALSAVDMEGRLATKCGENDTIAVAFTSAVSDTAASYLKGEIAVNDVVASLKMHDVDNKHVPEGSNRMFTRLARGLCPRYEAVKTFLTGNATEISVISLSSGEICPPDVGSQFGSPQTSSNDKSYASDGNTNLRFIIPVVVCVVLLACAGFIYVRRQKKSNDTAPSEAPKDDGPEEEKGEKEDASSQPYVLTTQTVI
ncbi:unnamed protein product [Phytophthora fragariaefolia]|uniref:Unnamed protein product n=1 Tax=Phytophthora fragariaefolia TaxID=1490495 RepID=A0A9W6X6Y7_9STRA|nr:unnamed protein product [Phytophthora fragariaefolia]